MNGANSQTLGYDGLNRLTTADAPSAWGGEAYSYGPLNNLRSQQVGTVTLNYQYDIANRLTSLTTSSGTFASYQYDGNCLGKGG